MRHHSDECVLILPNDDFGATAAQSRHSAFVSRGNEACRVRLHDGIRRLRQILPPRASERRLVADRGQFRYSRPILSRGFYAACRRSRALRRAIIASTSLEFLVPHSQRGASAFPKVLPKAVREYSTFGGISPKSTRSMIPSACNSLSC